MDDEDLKTALDELEEIENEVGFIKHSLKNGVVNDKETLQECLDNLVEMIEETGENDE